MPVQGGRKLELHWPGVERCIAMDLGDHLYLVTLRVKPEWRGQGIGSTMIRRLKREGKPIELYPVPDTQDEQAALERFYWQHGFKPLTTRYDDSNLVWKPEKQ